MGKSWGIPEEIDDDDDDDHDDDDDDGITRGLALDYQWINNGLSFELMEICKNSPSSSHFDSRFFKIWDYLGCGSK